LSSCPCTQEGFGFAEFEDRRDAEDAVKDLDGKDLDGRRIRVEHTRGNRFDGGGGGRDFDRGRGGGMGGRGVSTQSLTRSLHCSTARSLTHSFTHSLAFHHILGLTLTFCWLTCLASPPPSPSLGRWGRGRQALQIPFSLLIMIHSFAPCFAPPYPSSLSSWQYLHTAQSSPPFAAPSVSSPE